MGAVLSQYDDDIIEYPIGYYSRKLIDSETRWSIWELELGAVVWHLRFADRTFVEFISSW